MTATAMSLRVLLPFQVFAEEHGVSRIVAETRGGSFGLLPHRLDCAAALIPGILTYQCGAQPAIYLAVDAGVLVKTGPRVLISVRRAIGGKDLGQLRQAVEQEFLRLDQQERDARSITAKLETTFLSRFAKFQHE